MTVKANSLAADRSTEMLPPRGDRKAVEQRLANRRIEPWRPSDTPLVWVAVATGCGGAGFPIFGVHPVGVAVLSLATLGSWLFAWRKQCNALAGLLLLLSVALVAAAWGGAQWNLFSARDIGRFTPRDAEPVVIDTVVVGAPTVYRADESSPFRAIPSTDRTVVQTQVVAFRNGTRWEPVTGRCEVAIDGHLSEVMPGDRLRVFGQLRQPEPAKNPGQRDAAQSDRADRQLARVWTQSESCVSPVPQHGSTDSVVQNASGLRGRAVAAIDRHLDAEASPLVRAMLLGDASGLSRKVVEAFRHTGTLHVLVVSGLHVGLVAAILPGLAALGWLPRRVAWIGSLCLVIAYLAIAGGRPPAIRAGIVAIGIIVAALCGRRALNLNSLAGAAVAVFAVSPGAWQSAGTRLSFLATATLLVVAAVAGRWHARSTQPLERLIRASRSPLERLSHRLASWVGWLLVATVA
ncbi:MAG: ComEC/Rec2 family competence protein, partial [Planctomycetota bacterium]